MSGRSARSAHELFVASGGSCGGDIELRTFFCRVAAHALTRASGRPPDFSSGALLRMRLTLAGMDAVGQQVGTFQTSGLALGLGAISQRCVMPTSAKVYLAGKSKSRTKALRRGFDTLCQ